MVFAMQTISFYKPVDNSLVDLISRAVQQSPKFSKYGPVESSQVMLYSDIGNNKRMYKVDFEGKSLLAIGLARDVDYDLYGEFKKLEKLWKKVPEYFPEPYFFHDESGERIMGMEFFPQSTIRESKPLHSRQEKAVAYEIGFALGVTYQRTGLINEEPHDDNVLIDMENTDNDKEVLVKLIDAMHYREGTWAELIEAACEQQELCREYKKNFSRRSTPRQK